MLKKILLLLAASLIISALWFSGLETIYARVLTFSSNVVLHVGGRDSRLAIEKDAGTYYFRVNTRFDGRKAHYTQVFGSLLIPTVMILAWQSFSAFYLSREKALKATFFNLGILFSVQILFLLLLTLYHSSSLAKYIYDMMMGSFYIFALVLIIIDNFRNPFFLNKRVAD